MQFFIGFVTILVIVVEISSKVVAESVRGRKQFDPIEDGFFEDFGFKKGQYTFGEKENKDFTDIRTNVPGEPGIDYPVYLKIPKTTFSCIGRNQGYYADDEAGCQVFHVCDADQILSFLCPVGSLFSQRLLTCDWWSKVSCSQSHEYYNLQSDLNKISFKKNPVESAANFQKNYIARDDHESEKMYSLKKIHKDSPIIRIATLPKNQQYSRSTPSRDEQLNKPPVAAKQSMIAAADDMEGKESIGLIDAHSELTHLATKKPLEYITFTTTIANKDQTASVTEMARTIKTHNIHNLSGFKFNSANQREHLIIFNGDQSFKQVPEYQKYTVNYHTHYLPDTFLKYQHDQRSTINNRQNIINNEDGGILKNTGFQVCKNNENAHRINLELQQGKPINLLWAMYQVIANTETLPRPFTNANINHSSQPELMNLNHQPSSRETNDHPNYNNKMADELFESSTVMSKPFSHFANRRTMVQTEFIPSLGFDFSNEQEKKQFYDNIQQDVSSLEKKVNRASR